MQQLLLIIHVLVAVTLVVLVLLQHGKGADMGATFGSGSSSNSMFGSQGALPFLVKFTGGLAVVFFITSLALNYLVTEQIKQPDTYDLSDTNDQSNVPGSQGGPMQQPQKTP